MSKRLAEQLMFLREIDKLKHIIRQTVLINGERKENTGEHSWHVSIAAITLAEYADTPIDILRVVKMLLIHDIVEVDAGDTFAYDVVGHEDKYDREQAAADRIFGLLPPEQGNELRLLWEEFESVSSDDSRFANAIDQIMPFLHNIWVDGAGGSWEEHHPTYEQVYDRHERRIKSGSTTLWAYAEDMLAHAVEAGWLTKSIS